MLATVGVLVTAALTAPAAMLPLGLELDRGAAGRRGGRLDRRGGGVLPAACRGAAAAAARQRDARGRIRHQRSVRDLPHHRAGRDPAASATSPGSEIVARCWCARRVLGARDRLCRRPGDRVRAQPARPAAGPARAVRGDRRAGDLRRSPRSCTARASSRSISPAWWSATARRAPTTPSSSSSMPRPGWRRSRCSCCSGCWSWPERLPDTLLPALAVARDADADRAAGGGVPVPRAVPVSAAREGCSSPGSACAARSASFSPRSRCWSGCRTRSSISTSASSSCWSSLLVQGWTIAPAARWLHVVVAAQRSAAAPRRARSAGPARAGDRRLSGRRQQPLSAPRRCCRPGRSRRWWCATSRS